MTTKIFDTLRPYVIYIPVASTVTGLYHLFNKKVEPMNSEAKTDQKFFNIRFIISLFPVVGNLIVLVIDLFKHIFPSCKAADERNDFEISSPLSEEEKIDDVRHKAPPRPPSGYNCSFEMPDIDLTGSPKEAPSRDSVVRAVTGSGTPE